jgi:hypothetical protein
MFFFSCCSLTFDGMHGYALIVCIGFDFYFFRSLLTCSIECMMHHQSALG